MSVLRVLIADDHPLLLAGIRRALEESEHLEVVGAASVGSQVLPLIGRTNPDVVLLDIRMPELDGLACLQRIRKHHPNVKVVMLSAFTDSEHVQAAGEGGAAGYVVKSLDPASLPGLLCRIVEGEGFSVHGLPEADDLGTGIGELSEREVSVLREVARGLSNKEIGAALWVTEQTVKFHLRNIYRKLDTANRAEAARYAYTHGLVDASRSAGRGQ